MHIPIEPIVISTLLLAAAYVGVAVDRMHRAVVVGVGACTAIIIGLLSQEEAIHGVDFNTIMLLAGMMIIVGIMKRTGIFQYLAIWSAQLVRGSPAGVLIMLSVVTAVVSAFLDNVTTVLLVVPVTLAMAKQLDAPPYPFLFAEIFASNIGGTATLIGDPPNIMIGSAVGLAFNDFVMALTPVIVVILGVQILVLHLWWGRKLKADPDHRARIMAMRAADAITDARLTKQALAVVAIVVAAFITARLTHLEAGTIAMAGAVVLVHLMLWHRKSEQQAHELHATFTEVEWGTLFFFMGLFVLVTAVEKAGLLDRLARALLDATGGDRNTTVLAILWGSAILSAVLDNIPFVATMIPLVREMGPQFGGHEGLMPFWWALALGACLGGNGTLVGASANLTVAGLAVRQGVPFSFKKYTLGAFPLMLVSIAIAHVYLWWRWLR